MRKNHAGLTPIREEYDKKLRPCPFCGSPARLDSVPSDAYTVECTNCMAQNEGDTIGGDAFEPDHRIAMQDAVDVWNARVED